jgi:hypothetical protein
VSDWHLLSFFSDPEDVRSLCVGQSGTSVMEQCCYDLDIRLWGTNGLPKRPLCIGTERARNHLLFYSILFYSILFYSVLFYSIPFYSILFYPILLYCIVLYCIVLYCIVLYCIVLYCIVLYCILFYSIPFHSIVLYCILYLTAVFIGLFHHLHNVTLNLALYPVRLQAVWSTVNNRRFSETAESSQLGYEHNTC